MALAVQPRPETLAEPVFAALDDARVTWCLLRGAYTASTDTGSDIDLLVERKHVERADRALRALGFARVPSWGRGAHRFYLTYDQAADRWLKIDLDAELSYGCYEQLVTRLEAGCLARRVRHAEAWVLAPDDTFWTLLMHCLLDKRAVRPEHQAELAALASSADPRGELAAAIDDVLPDGWSPERLVAAVQAADWDGVLALAEEVERRWVAVAGFEGRRRSLANGLLQRSTKLLNLTRRRGITVALLGPDGAGKSTLAAEVQRSYDFPVRSIYMGLYQRGGGRSTVPGFGLGVRLLRLWRNCLRAAYHQARGRLVLYDRFSYDHRLGIDGPQPLKRRARRWLLAHACPAPDLTLVLDAPGELLYARKGEHSPEGLEAQRRRYRGLADHLPDVEIVDATQEIDDVRREIVARIWRRYAARWS
jgi:thymidylate kinase